MKMLSCKNSLHVSRNRISWAKKVHCLLLIEQKYEEQLTQKSALGQCDNLCHQPVEKYAEFW